MIIRLESAWNTKICLNDLKNSRGQNGEMGKKVKVSCLQANIKLSLSQKGKQDRKEWKFSNTEQKLQQNTDGRAPATAYQAGGRTYKGQDKSVLHEGAGRPGGKMNKINTFLKPSCVSRHFCPSLPKTIGIFIFWSIKILFLWQTTVQQLTEDLVGKSWGIKCPA